MTVLDDFVDECRALAGDDTTDRWTTVSAAMERLVSDPAALAAAIPEPAVPDPEPIAGIDEIVFEDDTVSVILVHTPPGTDQPPHDHLVDTFIGVYEGVEVHRFFARDDATTLVPAGGRSVGVGETVSMRPEAVHAIAAEGPDWCRAVHVYLGPLSSIDRSIFHPETFAEERLTMARYEQWCRPQN